MTRPTPNAGSIYAHFIKDVEHIPGTNDLWLAQATRAVKNPGKGEFMLVLLRPETSLRVHGSGANAGMAKHGHRFIDPPGYRIAGYVKTWPQYGFKVEAYSPVGNDPNVLWERQHRATLFASDYATARRLLIVLAKELVYDRP